MTGGTTIGQRPRAKTRVICVLSVPRTGSTVFCRAARQLTGVEALEEIFKGNKSGWPERLGTLPDLIAATGLDVPSDITFRDFVRTHPNAVVDYLLARTEKPVLLFKVFPNHLSHLDLESLLARPDIAVAFIRRAQLQAHISHQIAKETRAWEGMDTTRQKARLTLSEFEEYTRDLNAWFSFCEAVVQRHAVPHCEFEYDRDLNTPLIAQNLRDRLHPLAEDIGQLCQSDHLPEKQNREDDPARKVDNWAAFERALRRHPDHAAVFKDAAMGRVRLTPRGLLRFLRR